jgi:hypothetical protein
MLKSEISLLKAYIITILLGLTIILSMSLLDYAKNHVVVSSIVPSDIAKAMKWMAEHEQYYRIKGIHEDFAE